MLLVCLAIARLVSTNTLPSNTSATLSKLTFHVITPCMLCTRLAATLGSTSSTLPTSTLIFLPLAMAVQIALGYAMAWVGVRVSAQQRGWHPQHQPTKSASVIAATTAAALGVKQASNALLLPTAATRSVMDERIAVTAATFGNSLTLPLVFFSALFSDAPVMLDVAIACTALVQIAWYPLLWSVGYQAMMAANGGGGGADQQRRKSGDAVMTTRVAVANRVGVRMVGSGGGGDTSTNKETTTTTTSLIPPAHFARACRTAIMRTYNTSIKQYINPPLVGVAAGVVLGATGLWTWLKTTSTTQTLPIEVNVIVTAARWVLDVVELLGSGALACQAIVLGASLSGAVGGDAQALRRVSMPLVVVVGVRLLILPLLVLSGCWLAVQGVGGMHGAHAAAWRMAAFVLCVQAAMPPAQSLSIMAQLAGGDGQDGGGIAAQTSQLLLQVYALAIVPLTIWVGVFMRVWLVG